MKPRHIGIVAVSAEGAALCYRTVCSEGAALLGAHDHPEISMHTFSLARYMDVIRDDDWLEVGEMMLRSAQKLVDGGAELLICPDNTVHQALDLVRDRAPAPWLHIAEEVARVATQRSFQRLGVLGTRYLMEGPVYRTKLAAAGIAFDMPDDGAARDRINSIIFDELVYGVIREESRVVFQREIDALARRGCDAVVLGCTEIPLIISDETSSLPTIDSTRTLARAALREACTARA